MRVELLLPAQTDHPFLRRAARSTVARLLHRGVVVHEYQTAILHAKSAVLDEKVAIVGSSNLDRQSLQHNFEINLVVDDGEVPRELDALFDMDVGRSSELTLDMLARRPWWTRTVDRAAAWLVRVFV